MPSRREPVSQTELSAITTDVETPPAQAAAAEPAFVAQTLRPGARLDEFEIVRVLGEGGFGIVYLALDQQLLRYVAIKEFFPSALASRSAGGSITARSPEDRETFQLGLESFFNEGRMLARFDDPALVRVFRFWKANGTAYMAMQYYPGQTLKQARTQMAAPPDEAWLRRFVERVLGALEALHREGVYHRDIAPDNILLLPDGEPVILDFGSARRVIGDRTQSLTAFLKPNYSPVEQYVDDVAMRQGAYTDLYALGGTVYFMLTGADPTPAVMRAVRDAFPVLSLSPDRAFQGVSAPFLAVVDWMLSVSPEDRPQTVEEVRAALRGERTPPAPTVRVGVLISESHEPPDPARAMAKTERGMPRAATDFGPVTVLLPRRTPLVKHATAPPAAEPAAPVAPARRRSLAVLAAGFSALVLALAWVASRGGSDAAPVDPPAALPAAIAVPTEPRAPAPSASASVSASAAAAAQAPATVDVSAVPAEAVAREAARAPNAATAVATGRPRPAASAIAAVSTPVRAPEASKASPPTDSPRSEAALPATAQARTSDAAGPCPDMNFFSRAVCLSRSCELPRWSAHPLCVETRRIAEERSRRADQ